jgi:acyl-CoA reductase-like NAD-dependent aldehyde dehydrogenase
MLSIHNPADGKLIRELPEDDATSIAAKYAAARAAQPVWAARLLKQRIDCVKRFRAQVAERLEPLARTLTKEMGKPIRQSRAELAGLSGRLDFFCDNVERAIAHEAVMTKGDTHEWISHEPLGVIANVSAWNYPFYVGSNVFIPALLTGNAVLYKPSEYATLTGLAISEMLHAAGVPKDVFQVLVGGGGVGAALVEQPIDGVFFTGSYATGKRIAESVAGRMVKLQLELGGKDPAYICEDVDIAKAAASVADGAFYNAGQSCCAVERIYVHKQIHDKFVDSFLNEVENYKVGTPMDETTYVGPLTRAPQLDLLARQVADAKAKGAKLLCGGHRLEGQGNYFAPTVLTHANHSMEVMREESFGPIIGIQKVGDDEEALELMNDTDYGLTAGVYTVDQKRAEKILARVKTGSVYWNCCDRVSPRLPWSGVGHSGMGLTLSIYGIQTFCRTKAWHLRAP